MHRAFVLVVALYSMQQTQVCHGDKNPATGLPQFAKAKYFGSNTDGATRLVDPLARELRIEVAKQEILRKLGMTKRPPKMNNLLANIPKPVFDGEISSLFSNGDDEEPSKTTQVVIPADEGGSISCTTKDDCYNFHLSNKLFKNQVIDFATLQFFKDSTGSRAHKVRLEDYGAIRKLIALNRVPVGRDWISMRVEKQIEDGMRTGKSLDRILSFRISCEDCVHSGNFKVSNKPRYRPFLLLKTSERRHKHVRKRRSFSVDCIPGYDKCCRQSLYVTFKEIGWHDWIIEPTGFEVNACKGRCSGGGIYVAKGHGFVKKELMRKKKNNFLSVCCVPTKFGRLTLLHFDEDGLIFKTTLKNMVVKECGCM